ncbi:MAG: TonB-dependent receptor, partial [bacterium]|nr:TonB-dependent receptor [bacterium]
MNGYESSSHRGTLSFSSDFGRDAITNLRMGTPSRLSGPIGNVNRGFRNWSLGFFAGDNWRARPALTLFYGIRYEPVTRPWEVNGFNQTPYGCQCTNFAPRAGFAYNLPGSWGLIRGSYGLHYGEIAPVTFGQLRFNPPHNAKFEIRRPDLRIPIPELMQ